MLRALVLGLLLANAWYFAWSQNYLKVYGLAPANVTEPQRLLQQVRPEELQLLSAEDVKLSDKTTASSAPLAAEVAGAGASASAGTDTPSPSASEPDKTASATVNAATPPVAPVPASTALTSTPTCLQTALLDATQAKALSDALNATHVNADHWRMEPQLQAARWIIYMGKYDSADAVTKKRGELKGLNIPVEPLRNPAMEPGLSLGGYDTQALATAGLAQLALRGVRTARVAQERPEVRGFHLRVTLMDESLKASLDRAKPMLGPKGLTACAG
jgi:hypothetical protein